jgi:hypothetical protein
MGLAIELQTISSGYDRKTCWVHPRAGAIPGDPPIVVLTMHKLRITGDAGFELKPGIPVDVTLRPAGS